ncbi:MAG: type II toxin-antitoxin system VapC family toxin [Mucilaginibacter sp.]|uniref:type II toxin-antitoxin system VapC family toxin n=1 Tax=Mucilaginibacter sp. TaxID=1882438 RepID=UPI003266FEC0
MTGNSCLLDTSVIIHSFKNPSVAKQLDSFSEIFVPSIAAGELYFGAYRSSNPSKHLTQVNSFLQNCTIVVVSNETAILYGSIKADLLTKGKPIPENDIWIAAVAIEHQLPLFTTDNHFKEVDGISLVNETPS